MTAAETATEDPELKALVDQGAPKSKSKVVPQPGAAGVCEEYHRAQPHLGLKRFYVRALNAECHVGKYLLAPDPATAEKLYTAAVAEHLAAVGYAKNPKTGGWQKDDADRGAAGLVLRTEPLTD
ncbi:hypothetical protein [Frigoriglobus tundricola]|uniref:Uncharacterized protein n=1 Tax=Frigoriglobus tundricola TaxID=2774151 RepID=A0A6M5Z0F2_9BACT|nr:hypothetical protein [Frigoriglobus tundricola]QJW98682.1 hypothetical protein FTUN_6277 [Frigoriglobus tundricola]